MALNDLSPYRLVNAYTKKDEALINQLWPRIKQQLEETYKTQFILDDDFNIYYDNEKATKEQVLKVVSEVYKQYYTKIL